MSDEPYNQAWRPSAAPALHAEAAFCVSSLAGWRVVITRAADQADTFVERLRAAGAEPIVYPTVAFAPPEDTGTLDQALQRLSEGGYDWLVVTSANAVRAVAGSHGGPALLADCQLAAVGPATAAACRDLLGQEPAVMPETFVAEALAVALGDMCDQRVLVLNSDLARPTLVKRLQAASAAVERVVAYRTVSASGGPDMPALLAAGQIDALTFASGSAVRFFIERIGPEALEHARRTIIACIGPVTAEAARAAGLPPTVVAAQATEAGLVEALQSVVRNT